jgi:hypothetical protein
VVSKTDTVHFNPSRSHYYRCVKWTPFSGPAA